MPLQDTLDAFKADFESGKPPFNVSADVVALMHRATAELEATGQARRARGVGDRLPNFALPTPDGKTVSSLDVLAERPLVLSFYRGVWCPYCNFELEALEAARTAIEATGAALFAVSPQTATNSRKAARQSNLGFPILIDEGNEFGRELGLVFRLPDYLIEGAYKKLGAVLPSFNGDDSWELPMPARYVVGQDGVIAYAEVNPDYTQRPDPSEMLPVLRRLAAPVKA
ncbi:MAG: peroxiredoxin-like family protein [Pseudomonadota bacterium]